MKTSRHLPVYAFWAAVLIVSAVLPLGAQTAAMAGDALLNPGDVVEVRVLRHDADLGGKYTIGSDGAIELQLIGRVRLQGSTPQQASHRITALLADGWLRKPQVAVNVADFAKNTITVTGQVNRGGAFSVPRNKPFTVTQAVGMAGGFNTRANQKGILLKRGTKSFTIDVKAIFENPSLDLPLKDGDVLMVRESRL
jgi:polysaccharide export outer membrane protein